jgi:vacuolar-type H+-ATPase subunit E/Vma4
VQVALSPEDKNKLEYFTQEAMNDAKTISDEIEEKTEREFQEKIDEGEKKILAEINNFIQQETEKIKKEKVLEVSQANVKSRKDYFKYGDAVELRVMDIVSEKLKSFIASESYGEYLFESCKNIIEKTGTDIDILYMPGDEELVTVKVRTRLENSGKDISRVKFKKDAAIKVGGLRFYDHTRNIIISGVFDEKTERAKELLNSIIGPKFMAVR